MADIDLEAFVRRLNRSWLEGRLDDLRQYFADDVCLLPPGTAQPIMGVDAVINTYREFLAIGTLHRFELSNITTFVSGNVGVCRLDFDVDYEIESGRFVESGSEVYVLDLQGAEPKIIWRTQYAR